jgi:predicted nucleic acid-binding protein
VIIVSNATPLIALARIGSLDLLKSLFTTINIPQNVYHEVVTSGPSRPGAQAVAAASWIVTRAVTNRRAVTQLMNSASLDRGESEAILIAHELKATYLILDDLAARKVARRRHLPVIGTAGILLLAKTQGLIPAVQPALDALITAGLYLHPAVYRQMLRRAGEASDGTQRDEGTGLP